ncbi:MAG: redoxin family protein, partial [Gemmataceae bacterium]
SIDTDYADGTGRDGSTAIGESVMTKARTAGRILGFTALVSGLCTSTVGALPPAPKVDEFAATQPKYPGVVVGNLTPAELARGRVEVVPGADGKPMGHALLDANGRVVRRFLAVNTNDYNIKSFYLDGNEVYREIDANGNGKPDQYRWFGVGGSKWGYDQQETGRVSVWARISPEEVSKELFEAIQSKDTKRLETLLPTEQELATLGLRAQDLEPVRKRVSNAAARLQQTATQMNLTATSKWVHVELGLPQTTPADAFQGQQDLIRHRNAGVLVEKDAKSAEFFQTGEMIQIMTQAGISWRLIDGPSPGNADLSGTPPTEAGPNVPEKAKELVKQLTELKDPIDQAQTAKFHSERAAILEKIVAVLQGDASQEQWVRQLVEAHANAAEAGVKENADRLTQWKGLIDKTTPKTSLAAFAAFRVLSVENTSKMNAAKSTKDVASVQSWWKEQLEGFIREYPTMEETPEAMFRLAMSHDFSGKNGEGPAKQWYGALVKNFANNPLAAQSTGALRRLESEGQPFQLSGPNLTGKGNLAVSEFSGKVVIVYYWASWSRQLKDEAAFLTDLMKKNNAKGLEIVTVCMDPDPKTATNAINAVQLPGLHMFAPNNSLTNAYGVMGPHIFVVGKDGKVTNKNAHVPDVGDEIEKLLK